MRRNRDKLLGVAAVITFIIGALNALDYFFVKYSFFKEHHGIIAEFDYSTYDGRRNTTQGESKIKLEGSSARFFYRDIVREGSFVDVEVGDTVTILTKRWIQYLYTLSFSSNMIYVEKSGVEVFDALFAWKGTTFVYMCIFGGCALLLSLMYLDVVKGISLENWFQGKVLKNPAYLNKRKRR